MKKITKTEVKRLIKDVNYSLDNCIEFAIVDSKIEIFHFKECTYYGYCIDGFIAR